MYALDKEASRILSGIARGSCQYLFSSKNKVVRFHTICIIGAIVIHEIEKKATLAID